VAIPQLQLPSSQAMTPTVDWSPLANLGRVYEQAQAKQGLQQALSEGINPSDPQSLAALAAKVLPNDPTMGMSLASLANTAANTQYQHGRDTTNDAFRSQEAIRAQSNADRSYGLQEKGYGLQVRAADRADQTPEEKAAERATAAQKYGLDPNSQEGRQFALTGQLPAPGPDATASQRAAVARQYGVEPASPQGKAFILTGKLPEQDTTFQAAVEQRKAAASANGLAPDSPGYQSFVLTGKMPKEDAQPLTATDKKAVLEADEKVQGGQQVIENLQKAKQLSKQAFSGPAAAGRGYAASFLGETSDTGKAGIATTDMNNLVTTNAVTQLKAIFGGNPTEGERAILLDIQGSASQPDAIRQKIFDRGIEAAQKRLAFEQQRADELRGGAFYKPQGGTSKQSTVGATAQPALVNAKPITQEQFNALPSGSTFTAPDGSTRIKP
jgi:hypothetical protein